MDKGLNKMLTYIKNLYESRFIIASFVKQDLKARYRGSFMGMLWAILTPLGMTLIIAAVYSTLWKADIHYFIPYLFSGLTPWTYLTACGDGGAYSYMGAEGYIKQLPVKLELFPVRVSSVAFINNLLFGLIAYFAVLIVLSPEMLSIWTLMIVPALLLFYIFGVSWATIAASIQVYLRDYAPMQTLIFQALFYVTPILYDFNMMKDMGMAAIYELNPFFYLIQIMRDALMGNIPNGSMWITAVCIVLFVFAVAQIVVYRTREKIVFRL